MAREAADERQTDVQVDENGRVYLPASLREQLGVKGTAADVRLTVEVLQRHES